MRPYISNSAIRTLNVPDFSGGTNYRDGISQVLDNQLTDSKNVWYKNGILQTRPGVVCAKNLSSFETDLLPFSDTKDKKVYAKRENFRVINGISYQLVVFQYANRLVFRYYADTDDFIEVAEITDIPKEDFSCNIFQYNADIYCFCSGYYEGEDIPFYIYKITEKDKVFEVERITQDKAYVPTLILNAGPVESIHEIGVGVSLDTMKARDTVMLEGYNLLGNRYKAIYSTAKKTDNPTGEGAENQNQNFMCYSLLWDTTAKEFFGQVVEAEITDKFGRVCTHRVVIDSVGECKEKDEDIPVDNLRMHIDGKTIYFKAPEGGNIVLWKTDDFVLNNMIVTAPCPNSKENYEKILNMTKNEWFGGGAEGIYGGIHLFMGGNTKEEEKALVCWSDFNKPLYFSENGYAYAGDKAQKVVAFGKQDDSLFIFKERELYSTKYNSASEVVSAEAVENQSVVDVTTAEVTFPMLQIHGFIGCDCPDTVQLCRNRLVWAHSDGKIYTLTSASQWNERSIYEVSGMVEPLLREAGATQMRNAISADWEGHYVLSVGDKFILMDYNSYGYTHVYSYTKDEDAQARIPFWVWEKPKYNQYSYFDSVVVDNRREEITETPISVDGMFLLGNDLYIVSNFAAYIDSAGRYIYELLKFNGTDDVLPEIKVSGNMSIGETKERDTTEREVEAMAQTKLFAFGGATVQKSIPKADISFGNNEGNPITVTTITDRGETSEEVILDFEETNKRNPQFFKSVAVRNGHKLNNRIGYRFESSGNIFLDSMTVYYKILGGSK